MPLLDHLRLSETPPAYRMSESDLRYVLVGVCGLIGFLYETLVLPGSGVILWFLGGYAGYALIREAWVRWQLLKLGQSLDEMRNDT